MGIESMKYGVDLARVKRSPVTGEAACCINDAYSIDAQQEPTVDNVTDETLIPFEGIREVVDGPIDCDRLRNEMLMLRKPSDYNQAVRRSMMKFMQMGMFFPGEILSFADKPVFREYLRMYLHEMGVRVMLPTTQVRFHGELEDEDVFVVHVADVIGEELHLSEIALCNLNDPVKRMEGGMGHGVFDEILKRMDLFGKNNGYKQIGLMAGCERNMRSYKKRGFSVEQTAYGAMAEQTGMNYPMVKSLQ